MFEIVMNTQRHLYRYKSNKQYWMNAIKEAMDYFTTTIDPEYNQAPINIKVIEIPEKV